MVDSVRVSKLNEHQKILLSILKDFDAVCRKHNIQYMLFAGTALGAVRHRGFIPWDDDADVIMMRSDYERFFKCAAKDFDTEKYFVQQEFSPHWPMQFSKLRLNNTACIEKYHPKDPEVHQGIYIDIFPCDNLSDNKTVRKLQFLASKIVIAKALYARGYETDSVAKKCFMQFCRLLPLEPFRKFCVRSKDSGSDMVHSFFAASKRYEKSIFPREWFEKTMRVPFEDAEFPVSCQCSELLTKLYGDYERIPPPEERRCKEHAAILDTECSYKEYLDEQQKMKIDVYTRSIR